MDPETYSRLGAVAAAQAIRDGALSAEDLMRACLDHIERTEPRVQAWAFVDPAHALSQARAADEWRGAGRPTGPLHGVPVGIKDIIDTADMPTEDGTPLHAGRLPVADATVVRMLRAAGAVIVGKTVTTELATFSPGKTHNPRNPEHTPGGSSSGSAAAVAAGMVPLAIGTQTNGSMIRPAAFCGVFGFKPTHGLVPRTGVLRQSPPLDQVGVFARSIDDVALASECIVGHDEGDPDTRPRARMPFVRVQAEEPPLPPKIAFVKTPVWDRADAETREAFAELVAHLGEATVAEVALPESTRAAWDWQRTIMEADFAVSFEQEYERGRDRLSATLRAQIERGRQVLAMDYRRAVARIANLNDGFAELFDRFDAILTPSAPGTAPRGLESTGDPVFCTLWTLCGMPALNVPLMTGSNGLPLGAQLVGRRGDDLRLLRTARWVVSAVAET